MKLRRRDGGLRLRGDAAARVVLETLLLRAADSATSAEREWVRMAAGVETSGVDVEVLRRILLLSDKLKEHPSPEEQQTDRERPLRRRLDALADFEEVASTVRADFEDRIEAIARSGVSSAG